MAKFLLCVVRQTSIEELKERLVFNILFFNLRLNIPKTIFYADKVIEILEGAAQYNNLLVNVQLYNATTLGIEITNINTKRDVLVVFILDTGIELCYTPYIGQHLEQLHISQEECKQFVLDKIKEIDMEG